MNFNIDYIKNNYQKIGIPKDIIIESFLATDLTTKKFLIISYLSNELCLRKSDFQILNNSPDFQKILLSYYKNIDVEDVINYIKHDEKILDRLVEENPNISGLSDVMMISKNIRNDEFYVYMVDHGKKKEFKMFYDIYDALREYFSFQLLQLQMIDGF